jgi:hypothetical protein
VIGVKKIIRGIFLLLFLAGSALAQGRYRQMNINLAGSYGQGMAGFDRLENTYSYSLWYSYWMMIHPVLI